MFEEYGETETREEEGKGRFEWKRMMLVGIKWLGIFLLVFLAATLANVLPMKGLASGLGLGLGNDEAQKQVRMEDLKRQISAVQSSVSEIQSDINGAYGIESKLEDLESVLNDVEDEVSDIGEDVETIEGDVSSIDSDVFSIKLAMQ